MASEPAYEDLKLGDTVRHNRSGEQFKVLGVDDSGQVNLEDDPNKPVARVSKDDYETLFR